MRNHLLLILLTASQLVYAQNLQIMNAFKQGQVEGDGNCISVALIKAAIERYGVGNVFMSLRDDNSKIYFVRLYSGVELQITYDEIETAAIEAKFILGKYPEMLPIKLYADTCFAVMAKHLEKDQSLQGKKKYTTFDEAISNLNNGYSSTNVSNLLGLNRTDTGTKIELRGKTGLVIYNKKHAAYASYGLYDEPSNNSGVPIWKFWWKYKLFKNRAFEVDFKPELLSLDKH